MQNFFKQQSETIFRGDTFEGNVVLIGGTSSFADPYAPLANNTDIEIRFPGAASSVSLKKSDDEVVITSDLTCQYIGSPEKSLLLKLGNKQSFDVIVTDADGNVFTWEMSQQLSIADRANL